MSSWSGSPEAIEFNVEIATTDDGPASKKIAQTEIVDSVKIGGLTCTIGSGGLHSADEPALFIADDVWTFLDLDVDSFYPALMINHRLAPTHLPADTFLAEFDRAQAEAIGGQGGG